MTARRSTCPRRPRLHGRPGAGPAGGARLDRGPPARAARRPGAEQGFRGGRRHPSLELRPPVRRGAPGRMPGGPRSRSRGRQPRGGAGGGVTDRRSRRCWRTRSGGAACPARPAPTWWAWSSPGCEERRRAGCSAGAPAGATQPGQPPAGSTPSATRWRAPAAQARDLHRPGRSGDLIATVLAATAATGEPARCWRVESARTRSRPGSVRCPRRWGWCPRWHARCTRRTSVRRPPRSWRRSSRAASSPITGSSGPAGRRALAGRLSGVDGSGGPPVPSVRWTSRATRPSWTANFRSSTGSICATSSTTRITGPAITTMRRTSPPRLSFRPTATSSAHSGNRTAGRCAHG